MCFLAITYNSRSQCHSSRIIEQNSWFHVAYFPIASSFTTQNAPVSHTDTSCHSLLRFSRTQYQQSPWICDHRRLKWNGKRRFSNQFPLKSLLKFKEEEDYLDNRVDVTDNINRNSIGEMNIVREMKIQSRDWLKRMRISIYALKVEDFKVNRRLQCSRCDYKSF